jgi:hypothetical protein
VKLVAKFIKYKVTFPKLEKDGSKDFKPFDALYLADTIFLVLMALELWPLGSIE